MDENNSGLTIEGLVRGIIAAFLAVVMTFCMVGLCVGVFTFEIWSLIQDALPDDIEDDVARVGPVALFVFALVVSVGWVIFMFIIVDDSDLAS